VLLQTSVPVPEQGAYPGRDDRCQRPQQHRASAGCARPDGVFTAGSVTVAATKAALCPYA
jgi:hypothetical protein